MKGVLCVQKMVQNCRSRGNRGTALRVTNSWRLQSWGGSRLWAHTNLDRARQSCDNIKVNIIVAVMEGVFVSNGQNN